MEEIWLKMMIGCFCIFILMAGVGIVLSFAKDYQEGQNKAQKTYCECPEVYVLSVLEDKTTEVWVKCKCATPKGVNSCLKN